MYPDIAINELYQYIDPATKKASAILTYIRIYRKRYFPPPPAGENTGTNQYNFLPVSIAVHLKQTFSGGNLFHVSIVSDIM